MAVTPPLRYIHIDDYSPVGIDNGPDDAAFANARADLAAYGYHTLVVGRKQYWLQNGLNLLSYTDFNNITYPELRSILITSDSFVGGDISSGSALPSDYVGLPGTIILSEGFADPDPNVYTGGSEPCRTTSPIRLAHACALTNLRIFSLGAYNFCRGVAAGLNNPAKTNARIWGPGASMASAVPYAGGRLYVPAGGGTAIIIQGDYCFIDNLFALGFRNLIVCTPQNSGGTSSESFPRIGFVKGDMANGFRFDWSGGGGIVTGPFRQEASLTAETNKAGGDGPFTAITTSGNATSTSLTFKSANLGSPLDYYPGQPLTILLSNDSNPLVSDGNAVVSPCNTLNVDAAGNPTNRYNATVTSATEVSGVATLTVGLAGVPYDSFVDIGSREPNIGSFSQGLGTITLATSDPTVVPTLGQTVSGTSIYPGTTISGSLSTFSYTVNTAQTTLPEIMDIFPSTGSAVITAKVTASTTTGAGGVLNVQSTTIGAVANGQFLFGDGVPPDTSVTSSLSANTWQLNNTFTIQSETLTLVPATSSTMASITSVGSSTTLVFPPGGLAVGEAVFGSGVLPGTFVEQVGTGTDYTINVMQSVGNTSQEVDMYTQAGTLFAGSIYGTSTTADGTSLTVSGYISGGTSLTGTSPLFGPGVLANTYITGGSSPAYTVFLDQLVGGTSPVILFQPDAAAITASVSGTVLTTFGAAPGLTSALSAGELITGSGILNGTTVTQNVSGTSGTIGLYSVALQQQISSVETFTAVPSATFLGSISGTTLTVSPTGTLVVGQFITGPSIPSGTKITSHGSSSGGTIDYTISNVVSPATPVEAITAVPTVAIGTASIGANGEPGNTLTVSSTAFGTFALGQQIVAPGISSPTTIVGGTSPNFLLSNSWYLPSQVVSAVIPQQGATFVGSVASGTDTLTVSNLESGAIGLGHLLVGADVSSVLYIQSSVGSGTYTLSSTPSGGIPSSPMATIPAAANFIGSASGAVLTVYPQPSLWSSTGTPTVALFGSEILSGTSITGTTTTAGSYIVNLDQTVGSASSPSTMTAVQSSPSQEFTGTVSGGILSATISGMGTTLTVGMELFAAGLSTGTSITSLGSTNGTMTGTLVVGVPQFLSLAPVTATAATQGATIVDGSVPGTILTGTVTAGTLVTGQVLTGAGIAFGTNITAVNSGSGAPGSSINAALAVPQYAPSTTTVYCVGGSQAIVGSLGVSSTSLSASTNLTALATAGSGALSTGSIVYGAGMLPATNIVSGSSSPYALAVPQPAATQGVTEPITLASPIGTSALAGTLQVSFPTSRPGRLIDLYQAPNIPLNLVGALGASTAVHLQDSGDVHIVELSYDGPTPDTTNTVIDLQGTSINVNIISGVAVDNYTFLNNQTSQVSTSDATGLRLIGCRAGTTGGASANGTVINHNGGAMSVTGCSISQGEMYFNSPQPAVFTTTEFAPGSDGQNATTISYGYGAAAAVFDQTCINVPSPYTPSGYASALAEGNPNILSALIGGQLGSDLGRAGYVVFPSAAVFSSPGDRQSGRIALGAQTIGTTPARLTTDGSTSISGSNSLPIGGTANATFGTGFCLAFNPTGGNYALWPSVQFLLAKDPATGATTLLWQNGTGTSVNSGGDAAYYQIALSADTGNNCLDASATGTGAYSLNWLFAFDTMDVGS